jgi:hypothetical protein
LHFLLSEGKLNNGGKLINKVLGRFRERKGKYFRDQVRDWLKKQKLSVVDYEVAISPKGHLKADKNYGDIDVLAFNSRTNTILAIECKDTNKAKNIHEMKTEMDNYLGRDGNAGMIGKHLNRHIWLNENKEQLDDFLNIKGGATINSFIFTSEVIPTNYLKAGEISLPIVAFSELKREGLKLILAE